MSRTSSASAAAKVLLAVLLAGLAGVFVQRQLCAGGGAARLHSFEGTGLGTTWSVKVAAESLSPEGRARIEATVRERLGEVDELMSTWDPDSELSRFNRHAAGEPFPVSPPTLAVFRVAQATSALSEGALDVTVGPLVEAWGFGASERLPRGPDADQLARLRERVGWQKVTIDAARGTLSKASADTVCDLSAVAKGYAVDRVTEAIGALGHTRFLVELGGELRGRGRKLDGSPWRVAVEAPTPGSRGIHRVVELLDRAMATSGDYRNFYRREGVWLSHLIDPRTARPIAHGLASVTVVHDEAVWADAWATALIVLGPEEGLALAERQGLAAYFIVRQVDGRLQTQSTRAFEALADAA